MSEKNSSGLAGFRHQSGCPGISGSGTDAALALGAGLLLLAINAVSGFAALSDFAGDNDSLLRLVQIRDLIAGQSWFDLHQHRMGPEGGFAMHWSRLVDAPIAAIILAASVATGSPAFAEAAALVLWPTLIFGAALYFLLRVSRIFGGENAALPAAVIGGAALYFIGVFSPGGIDHHNLQLATCLASLFYLLEARASAPAALVSGACAAIMLAVGMETAPYVAALGICAAILFLVCGVRERRTARGFGCGFAAVSALVFVATIPASAWSQAQCDAFSVAHFAAAVLAGGGLAAIASLDSLSATRNRRVFALALLGLALAGLAMAAFPQCLSGPFSGLDPRLRLNWLDHVAEAQSFFRIMIEEPAQIAARYGTPLLALALLALRFRRGDWRRQDFLVAVALLAAFLVSLWQVRGSVFSISLAVVPLSAWVGEWRHRAEASASPRVAARMIAVWLVSVNAVWTVAAAGAAAAFEGESPDAANEKTTASSCQHKADFERLARFPATNVLTVSNLGSPILAYTGHHVFAGPYHRNVVGNLLTMDAFMGTAMEAESAVRRHRVGLIALCPGNDESALLARRAPGGLLAALMRGEMPDWLEPEPESQDESLRLYRVLPES